MSLDRLLKGVNILAILCNQWGDSGKGKFTDYFAQRWADIIVRGTGGANAGHTIYFNNKQWIFHLVPSGILYDSIGKVNILGSGTAIHLETLCEELDILDQNNQTYNNLLISEDANVVMPYHIEKDGINASLKKGGVGSTKRGIGPCYEDSLRWGIKIKDLLNEDVLREKLKGVKKYRTDYNVNIDKIISDIKPFVDRIRTNITNTKKYIQEAKKSNKKILIEGAQGLLLSCTYGTNPYNTCSDPSRIGTAVGCDILPEEIDLTLGIVKYPYMTRVGNGPFPSELGGRDSEEHCAKGLEHDIFYEVKEYLGMNLDLTKIKDAQSKGDNIALAGYESQVMQYIKSNQDKIIQLMDSKDPFTQGIGIRMAGFEYGATTKRPRRTGWTDMVALKYATGINGPDIILSKVDVVQGAEEFKLCVGYENGMEFTNDGFEMYNAVPVFRSFSGFDNDLIQIRDYSRLPGSILTSIDEEVSKYANVRIISTGPEPEQTIIR